MASTTDTKNYKFNHTMIRVKDPTVSIKFFEHLGMKLLKKLDFPDASFSLYFLGYDSPEAPSHGKELFDRRGLIEITHNWGTENDPGFKINNGNREPDRGFGHTCISVDNIQAACKRIEDAGYRFQKRLTDGRMRHIAFVKDPDEYLVEIISQKTVEETEGITTTDPNTYRMNHTMLRVKDAEKSLKFYQETLGMSLIRTSENKEAGFNLYFLGYPDGNATSVQQALKQGLLELTWNYGTETVESFKYHNGNTKDADGRQGFGHICISVDHIEAACQRLEELNVSFQKRLTDGKMKNIAFILDPDGYFIELVQNERFSGKPNF